MFFQTDVKDPRPDSAYQMWSLPSPGQSQAFLEQASSAGLTNLKGHRLVGGMRASIYNAMPQAGVDALVSFMEEFERTHG